MSMAVPPKDNPIRRNARVGPTLLPAGGRRGDPPQWPLPGWPTADEQIAWHGLWHTPQAAAWENLGDGCVRTVARYCRMMVAAEAPKASASLLAQVSNLEDKLGLTPKAMRMLLWQVAPDEVTEKRDEQDDERQSARTRLRAVESS